MIDIPYNVVSRDEYEWLVFSRKVLFVLVILLTAAAFTRQRAVAQSHPPVESEKDL